MQIETAQDKSAFERIRAALQDNAALHEAAKKLLRVRRWPQPRREVIDVVTQTTGEYKSEAPEYAPAIVNELLELGVLVVFNEKRDLLLLANIRGLEDLLLPPRLPPSVKPPPAGSAQAQEARRKPGRPPRVVPRFIPEHVMILAELLETEPRGKAVSLLRTLTERRRISWPLSGKGLGELLAACVGEADLSERPQTYKLMRDLARDGILADGASSGWYRPGPNFSAPSIAIAG